MFWISFKCNVKLHTVVTGTGNRGDEIQTVTLPQSDGSKTSPIAKTINKKRWRGVQGKNISQPISKDKITTNEDIIETMVSKYLFRTL